MYGGVCVIVIVGLKTGFWLSVRMSFMCVFCLYTKVCSIFLLCSRVCPSEVLLSVLYCIKNCKYPQETFANSTTLKEKL
jgi:hypothetical protein